MPRKAKSTPGVACAVTCAACGASTGARRRMFARPKTERFAGVMLMAVMRRAYERASYCSTAAAWLEPGRDQFRS